jgi:hypothetical protein
MCLRSWLFVVAWTLAAVPAFAAGDIDEERLKAADAEPENWFTLGRDSNETYVSPLAKIDDANIGRLGLRNATLVIAKIDRPSRDAQAAEKPAFGSLRPTCRKPMKWSSASWRSSPRPSAR